MVEGQKIHIVGFLFLALNHQPSTLNQFWFASKLGKPYFETRRGRGTQPAGTACAREAATDFSRSRIFRWVVRIS